jgi:hypothetical protein
MRPLERGRFVLPAIAIAAVAGGCGSGKQQVNAAELAQKGDAICREEQSRFDRIQGQPPANAPIAADQTKELIDVSEAASSDLEDLEPPEPMRDDYGAYLEARDRVIEEMKKGQDAAENQDSAGYSAAQTAVAQSAPQRHRLATAVGLRVCGANPRSG